MPNTQSAKKRLRQNVVRRERNRADRSALRSLIKKVHVSVASGAFDQAATHYRDAARALDQAGTSGLVHANMAARTKSRLSAMIKKAKAASAA